MGEVILATKDILTINIVDHIGVVDKGLAPLDTISGIIGEQLKLHPSYEHGDAELKKIVGNLQSLPADPEEKQADFYANIEWLKDWGDHGDRLLVIDDAADPYNID